MEHAASSAGGSLRDRRWGQRIAIGLILALFSTALVWGALSLTRGADAPKRQIARIMILPDTPPPPPPPEEKKPVPKEQPASQQQINTPKQETPPEPAPLKMEGQAGEGPSAFASGDVKQEYIGGDVGNGSRYAAYVARVEQRIQAELSRHDVRASDIKLFLWLLPDGSIQRFSVDGGDAQTERSVRAALAALSRIDEAPLADMPMPIGLRIN
ncbi:MAG: TonB-dependent receptor [Pseudomonadota bacterium]|nr:TonB-dependent receptor [Pseudomonadota bacterium]